MRYSVKMKHKVSTRY